MRRFEIKWLRGSQKNVSHLLTRFKKKKEILFMTSSLTLAGDPHPRR